MLPPTCSQHQWTAPDGETFPYSAWETGPYPRAIVVAVHGLSGAALDFEPLGRRLIGHNVATYAVELRGQGNDPVVSRRGDLLRIEDWFADLSAFFTLIRVRHPGAPIFYYGESMGSALLTRFLAQARAADLPDGVVLASPVVEIKNKPTWWQELIFRFFLWGAPAHRIDVTEYTKRNNPDDPTNWVTRDQAHRRWFESSSHKINCFTVRFFRCLRELITGCFDAATRITVPVLVLYAANDVFIPPARVEAFFDRLASRDKERQLFPGSYHLLLHDFDHAEALERIESWLLPRIELARSRATVANP